MSCELDRQQSDNLCLWQQSGDPFWWVEAMQGRWQHPDWLQLLADLRQSRYWPLDPDAVGLVLEETRRQWENLRRWRESGAARRWVEVHQGWWTQGDWLLLLQDLRQSDFWPLDPDQVALLLEELREEWWNLRHWQDSGEPRRWVEEHQGQWDHADWLSLLEMLRQSGYWPVDPNQVGLMLEEAKLRWWNLRRWQDSGAALRWVEEHQGRWARTEWQLLLQDLRQSDLWPLDVEALLEVLQRTASEWRNLCRWRESGDARRWVEAHQGNWDHEAWLSLLGTLQWSGLWPVDPAALGRALEEVRAEWKELSARPEAAPALEWAEAGPGPWGQYGWLALLEFSPTAPETWDLAASDSLAWGGPPALPRAA
jgi:hypothetical protein